MKRSIWVWFSALVLFNLVDFSATRYELAMWGVDTEANPVMATMIASYGISALLAFKVVGLVGLGLLLVYVGTKAVQLRTGVIALASVFGCLSVYHAAILFRVFT